MKILVVDDSRLHIRMMKDILETLDCTMMVAADAETALGILKEDKPDLILLDILLPRIDGLKLCRCIKSESSQMDIPVIFMTGQSTKENIIEGFKAGAVDYIIKPFFGPEVNARIKIHLDLKQARDKQKGLVDELKESLLKVRQLSGLLPICAKCKKIRDSKGYWQKVEQYISEHSEADFTHGLCPDCMKEMLSDTDK